MVITLIATLLPSPGTFVVAPSAPGEEAFTTVRFVSDWQRTGGAGADTLTGGGGDDQLFGGAGTDIYSFAGRFGADTLTGTSAISGTGNALANTLTGNAANNTLSGAEGNDTYVGGAGNDTLVDASTTSADVYTWGLGQGSDTINDAGGADRIDLGTGITAGQLTYSHVGSDLRIGITGQTDTLTVLGW